MEKLPFPEALDGALGCHQMHHLIITTISENTFRIKAKRA